MDPKVVAQAQEVGKGVNGKIIVDHETKEIILKLEPLNTAAQKSVDFILESFPRAFGEQLTMFFGIRGNMIIRNEDKKGKYGV